MLTQFSLIHALPASSRRGYSRKEAASYVGVSPPTFDKLVRERSMPTPVEMAGRKVWDRNALDRAFEALAGSSVSVGYSPLQEEDAAESPLDQWRRNRAG